MLGFPLEGREERRPVLGGWELCTEPVLREDAEGIAAPQGRQTPLSWEGVTLSPLAAAGQMGGGICSVLGAG